MGTHLTCSAGVSPYFFLYRLVAIFVLLVMKKRSGQKIRSMLFEMHSLMYEFRCVFGFASYTLFASRCEQCGRIRTPSLVMPLSTLMTMHMNAFVMLWRLKDWFAHQWCMQIRCNPQWYVTYLRNPHILIFRHLFSLFSSLFSLLTFL